MTLVSFILLKGNQSHQKPIRIGCLPILEHSSEISLFVAEEIAGQLQNGYFPNHFIYRYEWISQSFNLDSACFKSYLISFGQRIGLDLLILFKIDTIIQDNYQFHVTFYQMYREKRRIFKADHSLNSGNPIPFFENVCHQISSLTGTEIYSRNGLSWPSVTIWEKLGRARYYQLQQQWTLCAKEYREILEIDSTNISLIKELAGILLLQSLEIRSQGKQSYEKLYTIESLLNRVVRFDSTDAIVDRMFGLLYVLQERWNRAEEAFRKAYHKNRDDPFLYFYLARLHPSRVVPFGFKNRESLLKKAITINPAMVWAYLALGEIFYEKQRYREAECVYHQLLKIYPNSLDGLLALGKLYVLQNKMVKMAQVYEKIIKIAPHSPEPYYNLGILAYHHEKIDQAMIFFEKAISLGGHMDAAFYRAKIFEKQGKADSAIAMYRETLRFHQGLVEDYREEARESLLNLIQNQQESL